MTIDTEQFNAMATRLDEAAGTPLWLQRNYTEPRVNYAMKDLVKAGWVTYDVGCNFGGLTVSLSRLVGPRGVVCGFEANPIIAAKCQREMLRSGAYNSQLYQGAIYKRSGESIELFISDNAVADSIYRKTGKSISVQTIALDDFVTRTRLVPQFVKMDIEGAEADALVGFEQTIDAHHPTFILEHTPPDNTCLDFMLSKGYRAIDLQNYKTILSGDDILDGTIVTDVLYAMPEKLIGTPYERDLTPIHVETLTAADFSWADEKNYRSKSLNLQSGRYLARLNFSATGDSNTMCGVWPDDSVAPIMRVHSSSNGLVGWAREIVFDNPGSALHFFFHFIDKPDPSLSISDIQIWRVPGFDGFRESFSITP